MSDPLTVTVNALAPLVAEGIRALIQSADGRAALDTQLARMRAADPGSPIGPRIDAAIAAAMARVDTSPAAGVPAAALHTLGPATAGSIEEAATIAAIDADIRRRVIERHKSLLSAEELAAFRPVT